VILVWTGSQAPFTALPFISPSSNCRPVLPALVTISSIHNLAIYLHHSKQLGIQNHSCFDEMATILSANFDSDAQTDVNDLDFLDDSFSPNDETCGSESEGMDGESLSGATSMRLACIHTGSH
jgi:hypothetical protein